jgi:predicted metal-dependent phosphoesterase TrpH
VLEQAAGGAIGRPHVARAMIAEGWAIDFRDAFDRYLGNGRPAYVRKERLAVVDAIALIHRAGGLASSRIRRRAERANESNNSFAAGIDGVEVRHPSHSGEDIARLSALVDHLRARTERRFRLAWRDGRCAHARHDACTGGVARRQDGRVRARAA